MGFVTATLAVAALSAALAPWRNVLDAANIVMLYLLVVVGIALVFTRAAAIFSAVLGVAAFDFFFVTPRFSFAVGDAQYLLTFAVMLVVGLILTQLTAGLRQQAMRATQRAGQVTALYELARQLAGAASNAQVDELVRAFAARTLGGRCELWLASRGGQPVRVEDGASQVPLELGLVFAHGNPLEHDDEHRPDHRCLLLALEAPMRRRGVCLLSLPVSLVDEETRHTARMLASLAAIALERLHYVEVAHNATLEMETEKLRSVILSALSHDIRTPLTVMLGLADTLQQTQTLDPAQVRDLSGAIHGHATRLNDLAHKLLDMARLQSGKLQLRSEWQSIEEIVGAALAAVTPHINAAQVRTELPATLPLVEFDAVLIERVLCNLLDNAIRHAGPHASIVIRSTHDDTSLSLHVADNGPGLPADHADWLFQPFQRGPASGGGGVGLGLAICRTIARAHGGDLLAHNAPEGGAVFSLRLPRREPPRIESEGEGA
ncbi:hypothetical protein GCM10025770_21410 [Viridibacterium curvum]|uniref:histidine kinase n=2 Tax=Viridibacterium curvum TaxID=1101404 RepID=A0ABP9QPV5_9RHOO